MAVVDKRAVGDGPLVAEQAQPAAHHAAQGQRAGIIGAENGNGRCGLVAQNVGFGPNVGPHRLVPVQMVGRDVQHGGYRRALIPDFQLEAGQLLHHHIIGGHLVQVGQQRAANVATNPGGTAIYLPHDAGQGGSGRFARRTGNTNNGRWAAPDKLL